MKYMRILWLAFLPLVVFGQTPRTTEPAFDIADFNKKFEIAQWLVAYDTVAWKTSVVSQKFLYNDRPCR